MVSMCISWYAEYPRMSQLKCPNMASISQFIYINVDTVGIVQIEYPGFANSFSFTTLVY